MQEFKRGSKSYLQRMHLVAFGLIMAFAIGCHDDIASPASSHGPAIVSPLYRFGDTSQCSSVSGIRQLTGGDLKLQLFNSQAVYKGGSVLLPTPVSFSICSLDTAGTNLAPKVASFGPNTDQIFLRPIEVKLKFVDAGLPATTRDKTPFRLYRKNEITGSWDFVLNAKTGGSDLQYKVSLNGTYAVTLSNIAIDTTWTSTGLITPSGGTISLLTSRIEFPQGAVLTNTLVSFTVSQATPVGLPGGTNRVYTFGPEGIGFQTPVTLYVPFSDAGIEGDKITPLRFFYLNPSTNTWVEQPTRIDWENQRFVVTLSHFSQYAFGRRS